MTDPAKTPTIAGPSELRPGIVQRAYEIAEAGTARDLKEIEMQLEHEGYFDAAAQLRSAPALKLALRRAANAVCHASGGARVSRAQGLLP
jgi:hypothetical protein